MLNWTSRWFQPEGDLNGAGVANAMADTILNGISAPQRHLRAPSREPIPAALSVPRALAACMRWRETR
jgi:Tetracyclin repressor-like, C-terminal domain